MPGLKTNELPGTRAMLRHCPMSAYKARVVLDMIRDQDVDRATELLQFTSREAARVIGKLLASAIANAEHNDHLNSEELYVSACFADEGLTMKRWRPRARGRATRIRKRTCHITLIVSRMPEGRLERRQARQAADASARRARRVAGARRAEKAGGRRRRETGADAVVGEQVTDDVIGDDDVISDAEFGEGAVEGTEVLDEEATEAGPKAEGAEGEESSQVDEGLQDEEGQSDNQGKSQGEPSGEDEHSPAHAKEGQPAQHEPAQDQEEKDK